jgi:hypothetical protein
MDKDSRPNYLKMIKEFARQYNKHVIIVVPDQSKVNTSIWMTPSLLSHHALGTLECDESNDGEPIFGRRGAGNSFNMSHTATRGPICHIRA